MKTPLRRVPGTERFEPISWETAFREIGERTRAIRERHGKHAVATFLGNPAAFSVAHAMFAAAFSKGLGTRNAYGSCHCRLRQSESAPSPSLDGCRWLRRSVATPAAKYPTAVTS